MLWVLICTVHLTVCSSHLTYTFQRLFTLSTCLNVKKIFAQSRWEIWSLSDCNWARTQNHLVRKRNTPPFSQTGPFEWPGSVFVSELSGSRFQSSCSFFVFIFSCSYLNLRFRSPSSKEFLDIQESIECRFTLKRVRDMARTYRHFLQFSKKFPQILVIQDIQSGFQHSGSTLVIFISI